jgi:hypothetical protein
MNQRFTLDRKSFEQFLSVVSQLQQLRRQVAYRRAINDPNQPLVSLLQLQRAINAGTVDMDAAMAAVVRLALSVVGANSAGVWLFRTPDEFTCCARVGTVYAPERLGADILAHLAGSDEADPPLPRNLGKASHYPGYPNSVVIAPLGIGGKVVGALAAFSTEFDCFSRRDLDNLHFLAGLFEQAIQKAMRAGYREAVALEHTAIRQLLEGIMPHLSELEKQIRSQARFHGPVIGPAQRPVNSPSHPVEVSPQQPVFRQMNLPEPAATQIAPGAKVEDTSIPGVGVRAALGDVREYNGDSEPFSLRSAMRAGAARTVKLAAGCRSAISRVIAAGLVPVRTLVVRVASLPASLAQYRPALPTTQIGAGLARARNSVANLANRNITVRLVGLPRFRRPALPHLEFSRVRNASAHLLGFSQSVAPISHTLLNRVKARFNYVFRLGRVQARSLRRGLRQARADAVAILAQQRMTMRIASRRQKTVLSSSAEATGDALHHAGESLAEVATFTGHSTLTFLGVVKTRLSRSARAVFDHRTLRRSVSAVIVLAIMAAFLVLQATVRNSLHSEPVNAATRASTLPPSTGSQVALAVTTEGQRAKPGLTSHLEITDNSVSDALRDMTRYEIVTLQRAAEYGDDEAAFELGMAYETGYYVRQNCSKAAHWVKMAAQAGNPAAEYNLG